MTGLIKPQVTNEIDREKQFAIYIQGKTICLNYILIKEKEKYPMKKRIHHQTNYNYCAHSPHLRLLVPFPPSS